MIESVTPDVLGLLADGVPRTKAAIVEALAGRHDPEDATLALIRLAVTERVEETNGRYVLGGRVVADRAVRTQQMEEEVVECVKFCKWEVAPGMAGWVMRPRGAAASSAHGGRPC